MSENQTTEKANRTFVEEFEMTGNKVVDKVKEMIAEGNVRRLIVKTQDGRTLIDTSLTVGVGVGGFLGMIGGIPLAIFATLAMVVTKVKVEVVREVTEGDVIESKQKVEINVDEE
ncbi:MAG: DUF4342 domain-containing protein [Anaerolineae bacterium]|jgi:hypothetical protein|nr:DUF4342 domain-containing protein [Anaerolineae bacterium]